MIITKEVEILLCNRNLNLKKKYNLNPDLVSGDIAKISIDKLRKGSHYIIDVTCDYCGKELKVPYKSYNKYTSVVNKYSCSNIECSNTKIREVCLVKYGVENPFQYKEVKEKSKATLMIKYGVEHPMYLEATKEKIKETCLDRYGVESYTQTEEYKEKAKETCIEKYGVNHQSKTKKGQEQRKQTRINKGYQIADELIEPFTLYRKRVDNILDRIREVVFSNWDGFDYYDGEYIKENIILDDYRLIPTVDHKISAMYGFLNNIPIETIGSIENLCITKMSHNSSKGSMNEEEYKLYLKESFQ